MHGVLMVLKAMPTGRANARPMTGSASSGDGATALLHHEVSALTIDAFDPRDDGLGTQLSDNGAEVLQVIDFEIDGQFGEVG